MHTRLRKLAPFTPLVALALVAATPRPLVEDGWTFTWKIAVAAEGQRNEMAVPPSMKVSLVPGKARMDYVDRTPPGQKKGSYMIVDAERQEFTMVSPEDRKAIVMDPSGLGGALNAVGATGLVKMDVRDISTNVEKLGAGEKLLGHATTKYRITRGYTMEISVMGKRNRTTHRSVSEAWVADDRFIDDRTFEAWSRNFGRSFGGMGGDALKKLMAEEEKMPKGIMMKMVTNSTDTDDKGKATTSTMTMEMTDLQKSSLDAALFKVPAGYEVMDMKTQMAALNDSIAAAKAECEKERGKGNCETPSLDSAMKAGAKEGAKEGAKDAVKKGLRGILKRP